MSVVYGTYTQAELEAQYDTAVPVGGDSAPYLARFAAESERARATLPIETIRYSPKTPIHSSPCRSSRRARPSR